MHYQDYDFVRIAVGGIPCSSFCKAAQECLVYNVQLLHAFSGGRIAVEPGFMFFYNIPDTTIRPAPFLLLNSVQPAMRHPHLFKTPLRETVLRGALYHSCAEVLHIAFGILCLSVPVFIMLLQCRFKHDACGCRIPVGCMLSDIESIVCC